MVCYGMPGYSVWYSLLSKPTVESFWGPCIRDPTISGP